MRYLVITYMSRASGRKGHLQQDEIVSVANRLRTKDIDTASVILDFANKRVIKASLGDQTAPRDWSRIRDYYHQHYADVIDSLERTHDAQQNNTG
jgi:ribosomal protein L22